MLKKQLRPNAPCKITIGVIAFNSGLALRAFDADKASNFDENK